MRGVAFSPVPVSTTTVVSSGADRAGAAAACRRPPPPGRRSARHRCRRAPGRASPAAISSSSSITAPPPLSRSTPRHSRQPDRLGDGGALGDGRAAARRGSRPRKARAIGAQCAGCAAKMRGSRSICPAPQQLGEADAAAQHVRAGAAGHDDVVRRLEAEILPQLVGQRLGALQEEGVPVVAGVEDRPPPGAAPRRRSPGGCRGSARSRRPRRGTARSWPGRCWPAPGSSPACRRPRHRPRSPRRHCRSCPPAPPARPAARSSDSITEAPRSLKLPVGMNHSHFSSAVAPPIGARHQRRAALAHADRRAAAAAAARRGSARGCARRVDLVAARCRAGRSAAAAARSSPHQRGGSSGQVRPVRGSR